MNSNLCQILHRYLYQKIVPPHFQWSFTIRGPTVRIILSSCIVNQVLFQLFFAFFEAITYKSDKPFLFSNRWSQVDYMSDRNTNNKPSTLTVVASKLKAAVAYESAGKYESALMLLEEALALQENNLDAWLIKGVIYGKLGRCSEALKCYDKIIEVDPTSSDGWRLKSAVYTSMNLHDKAVETLSKAVQLDPANLEFRLSLAIALQRLKRFEDALQCYQEAKNQRPGDARIDYYIGLMWGNQADYQKALSSFEDALQLKPDFTDAMLAKGIMLARLNRKEEAKECADKLLTAKSTSEKPQTANTQSENESIRNDFKAAQKKFSSKYANPSYLDNNKPLERR